MVTPMRGDANSAGRGPLGGSLAADRLALSYLHLLDHGVVCGPYDLWDFAPGDPDYQRWRRFFDQQAALDGLRVLHESYVETSWLNARVVLARPDGTPYELPIEVDTYGWGAKHPSLFSSRGRRIYRRMERQLERDRRRAREADWGEILAAARTRARNAVATPEEAGSARHSAQLPTGEAFGAGISRITELASVLRRALANPDFEFDAFVVDPNEPYKPTPHADDCDGSCEAIIANVLYSCRLTVEGEGAHGPGA
jgi:hypothetical protein